MIRPRLKIENRVFNFFFKKKEMNQDYHKELIKTKQLLQDLEDYTFGTSGSREYMNVINKLNAQETPPHTCRKCKSSGYQWCGDKSCTDYCVTKRGIVLYRPYVELLEKESLLARIGQLERQVQELRDLIKK
jgi:hypothetical protein